MNIHKYTRDNFIPLKCTFDIIYQCNLKCIHCFQEENILNHRYYLSTDDIKYIIDELKALGCMEVLLTGGEVFLRQDIDEIMAYITSQKMGMVIFTNGTLLTEDKIKSLKKYSIFRVGVSIYGASPMVHDSITKVEGSFEKSINTLKLLKKHEIPAIGKVSLMQRNADDIRNIINLFENMGIKYEVSPFISYGIQDDCAPVKNRMTDEQIMNCAVEIGPLPPLPPKASPVDKNNHRLLCGSGTVIMHIGANGDVYPCMSVHKKAGNLFEKPLKEIWENSDVFKEIRKVRYHHSKCSQCDKNEICVRCPGVALQENGDFLNKPLEFCRITELWTKAFEV